jgi:hypothetical protein
MSNTFSRVSVLTLCAIPALMLAACGDLAPTPYHGNPYDRTAGSGVAYVRASMLPPREANMETITEKTTAEPAQVEAPPVPAQAPVTQGDHLFEKKQMK